MKITIIGSTGFVGSKIVSEALQRGHMVTAIARDPDKLEKSDALEIINTNIFDTDLLSIALTGSDAVISAYNPGWGNPDIYNLFLRGSGSIQEAVKKSGIKRLLIVGGAGSLFINGVQLVDSPQFPADIKPGASAARDYLNIIRMETVLEWTVISPPGNLQTGQRTGKYRIGSENPVTDEHGESSISVQDLAVAILDEIENGKFIRQRFTVGY